jgi:CheY-like chemotaxis protein/HD-like signal output (HDOD) protein
MANILLIDGNEVARKAMKGILARGGHRFASVADFKEGREFLDRHIKIDVVFMDLPAKAGEGMDFVRQLRQDLFFKLIPVVIYAGQADRAAVRTGIDLKVQNFLVKPYSDSAIFAEITKAAANPWRQSHFEEERSFCAMMGIKPDELRKMLDSLRTAMIGGMDFIKDCIGKEDAKSAEARLVELAGQAEMAGAWGAVECLNQIRPVAAERDWHGLQSGLIRIDFACRLIWIHINPSFIPDPMLTDQEREAEAEARERDRWFQAEARGQLPVVQPKQLMHQIETLPGCPVVDTSAAMFQMLANGQRASLIPIMEQVEMDPGLASQILLAANKLRKSEEDDHTPIEDLKLAIDLLGEIKLATLGKGLVTVEERLLHALPFTWPRFWMFQIAVARMSRLTCSYLEYGSLADRAYIAGLLHDFGKLLISHLYPFGWQAIMADARENGVPTAESERKLIGCTARELADHFAATHGLPDCYRHVMRWLESPEEAEGNQELVAIVALARDLCRRNHLGHDGDQPWKHPPPLEETPAWRVLGPKIFLGFSWERFEGQMHTSCQEIKRELHGWLEAPAV